MKTLTHSSTCSLTIILTEIYQLIQCPKITKHMFISRLKKVIKKVEKPKQLSREWTLFICSSYVKKKKKKEKKE